jgi:polysaccharide transporter, PST family
MLRTVIGNAGWLGLVQLVNYGLPVITLAIVAPAFGSSVFGNYAAISAYAAYAGLLVNYSFNLTGPRRIATIHDDIAAISDCVCAIIASQLLLAIAASCFFLMILAVLPLDATNKLVASIILVQSVAISLTPQWVFLGLEQMRPFSLLQLGLRLAATLAIFFAIRTPQDLPLLASISAGTAILIAILSFVLLRPYGIRWRTPTVAAVLVTLREAFGLFVSSLATNLYTTTNVIIVTSVLGPSAAGDFALADRLGRATSDTLRPITNAVYPFICRISSRVETADERSAKQFFFRVIIIASCGLSIMLFLFAGLIVQIVGGDGYREAVPVLRWMAFLPIIIALANIFGTQTMIPMRMDRQLTYVGCAAAILSLGGMFVLSQAWGLQGAGLGVPGVECFVTIALGLILARKVSVVSLFYSGSREATPQRRR